MDHPAALSSARWEAAARPSGPGPIGAEGAGGQGCGARGWRQGQAKYMHTKYRPMGGRRGACRAWPGFETTRRTEGSRRGRRAGGQAPRRSEIRRPGPKAPGTPAEHTKYRPIGGRRNPAGVKGAGGSGGHGRVSRSTTPSAARVWRSRGRPGPKAPGTPAEHTKQPSKRAGRPRGGRRSGGAASTVGSTVGQAAPYSPPTPGSGRPV